MQSEKQSPNDNYLQKNIFFWGLMLLAIATRLIALFYLPQLNETNYEEGGVGLMARHILKGEHIAFWWGQPYLGTLETYLTAFLFWFLPNTTFVLRLVPLFFSLLAALFSVLLAQKLFKKNWSLITLLWWAIPCAFLLRISLTVWNYINCVAYGNIILYLTWICLYDKKPTKKHWFLLGLFSGIAFWDHLICLCYLASTGIFILIHLLRKKTKITSFLIYLGGFFIGNFPFWFWNLCHKFETLQAMLGNKKADVSQLFIRTKFVLSGLMIDILGYGDAALKNINISYFLNSTVKIIYFTVLGFVLWLAVKYIWAALTKKKINSPFEENGFALIMLTFVFASGQVISSQYDKGIYLMPIYTAIPLLFTALAKQLIKKNKLLGICFLSLFLSIIAVDNFALFKYSKEKSSNSNKLLIEFLHKKNISHVYAHYRIAWALSFLSQEKIITSDLFGFINNLYYNQKETAIYMQPYFEAMREVDLSDNIAFVTNKHLQIPSAQQLEEFLKILNTTYTKETIENHTVFYNFQTPSFNIKEIPIEQIKQLSASHKTQNTHLTIDRNISTYWQTNIPAQEGMSLTAEFTEAKEISKILLLTQPNANDIPRSFKVETSLDGKIWQQVVETKAAFSGLDWLGNHFKFNLKGKMGIWFAPIKTKMIKITLGKKVSNCQWSISELFFYETDPLINHSLTIPTVEKQQALINTIKEQQVQAIYSSDIWNSFFSKYLPIEIKTITLTEKISTPFIKSERLVDFSKKLAFFMPSNNKYQNQILEENNIAFKTITFGDGELIITTPAKNKIPFYWDNCQLLKVYLAQWAEQNYLAGLNYIQENNIKEAIEAFKLAIREYPNMGLAYKKLLLNYQQLKDTQKIQETETIIKNNYTPTYSTPIKFSNSIEFLGLDIQKNTTSSSQTLQITYYWQYPASTHSCFAFVHFTKQDNDDTILLQDDHIVATTDWATGGIIKETRFITIPTNLKTTSLNMYLGLWDPRGTQKRFSIINPLTNTETPITKQKIATIDLVIK